MFFYSVLVLFPFFRKLKRVVYLEIVSTGKEFLETISETNMREPLY